MEVEVDVKVAARQFCFTMDVSVAKILLGLDTVWPCIVVILQRHDYQNTAFDMLSSERNRPVFIISTLDIYLNCQPKQNTNTFSKTTVFLKTIISIFVHNQRISRHNWLLDNLLSGPWHSAPRCEHDKSFVPGQAQTRLKF